MKFCAIKKSSVSVLIDFKCYALITSNRKLIALQCFDHHSDWKCINKRVLESLSPWKWERERHERDDFRGKLLQELFADRFPDYPKYGARTLEKEAAKLDI